jgi:hypothetical protein
MPGSHNTSKPRIRFNRLRASMMVCSRAWPMCIEPVTFGGGMTIENGGLSLCASAVK